MNYLKKSFNFAVRSPRRVDRFEADLWDALSGRQEERRKRAAAPHKYMNGGSMCQVCGLGDQAKIHELPNAR